MDKLNIAQIKALVHYDPETGAFRWLPRPRVGVHRPVGTLSHGYVQIRLNGAKNQERWQAHRLAWFYMTGTPPKDEIDHINGNPLDNRWCNLREADSSLNKENQRRAKSHNTTGLLGVSRSREKFEATIGVRGKRYRLGRFSTAPEAHAAYVTAKRQLHEGNTL
jgi:hypothetical protein